MAEQNVASNAAKHDVPDNEMERLLQTALGKEWLTNGMGSLSPEQLKAAHSLCADSVEVHARQIGALGRVLGNMDQSALEDRDVRSIGWTISHLADQIDCCAYMAAIAKELQTPEGRAWRLEGKIETPQGTVRVDREHLSS